MTKINRVNYQHSCNKIQNNNNKNEQKNVESNEKPLNKEIGLERDPVQFLGISQIQKNNPKLESFLGNDEMAASVAKSLEVMEKNPQLVFGSDRIFEAVYNDSNKKGDSLAYEKALIAQIGLVEDLVK